MIAALALAGCTDREAERQRQNEAALARSVELAGELAGVPGQTGNGLVFRLAFDTAVDLDLYVTDPLLETVYFANLETQTGGRLSADARCDHEAQGIRLEEIRFDLPYPGRYRVGVDYPERCSGAEGPAAYAVDVSGVGVSREARGSIDPMRFQVVVLEFELEGEDE